ncbi:MAG: phage holin [Bacillota bacterium]
MDFKTRLKNKTFVVTMLAAVIAFIYQVLAICNVVPIITQDEVTQVVMLVVNVLVGLGILVDPTTSGITDGESKDE